VGKIAERLERKLRPKVAVHSKSLIKTDPFKFVRVVLRREYVLWTESEDFISSRLPKKPNSASYVSLYTVHNARLMELFWAV